jgi:hypothetical protein
MAQRALRRQQAGYQFVGQPDQQEQQAQDRAHPNGFPHEEGGEGQIADEGGDHRGGHGEPAGQGGQDPGQPGLPHRLRRGEMRQARPAHGDKSPADGGDLDKDRDIVGDHLRAEAQAHGGVESGDEGGRSSRRPDQQRERGEPFDDAIRDGRQAPDRVARRQERPAQALDKRGEGHSPDRQGGDRIGGLGQGLGVIERRPQNEAGDEGCDRPRHHPPERQEALGRGGVSLVSGGAAQTQGDQ